VPEMVTNFKNQVKFSVFHLVGQDFCVFLHCLYLSAHLGLEYAEIIASFDPKWPAECCSLPQVLVGHKSHSGLLNGQIRWGGHRSHPPLN
jgi:hypothetical protein